MENRLDASKERTLLVPLDGSVDLYPTSVSKGSTPQPALLPPLRKRAPNVKSRSGCRTCKIRHVKCDEKTPACNRCTRIGEKCPGYPVTFASFTHKVLMPRNLAPLIASKPVVTDLPCRRCLRLVGCQCQHFALPNRRVKVNQARAADLFTVSSATSNNTNEAAGGHYDGVGFSLSRLSLTELYSPQDALSMPSQLTNRRPSFVLFNNENEQRYFDYYCNVIGKQLSGWAASRVWDFIVLQASHQELFVRHALVAIAALGKTFEMSQNNELLLGQRHDDYTKLISQHQLFAFRQYGKAIKLMREAIAGPKDNIRGAILACLLIVCFETFQGSNEKVQIQITNGIRLLHEWQTKQNQDIMDVTRLGSPAPDVVEDVLYFALCRLDIKTMLAFDGKPAHYHLSMALEDAKAIQAMPHVYTNLDEAEGYLSIITRRALHVLNAASPMSNKDSQTVSHQTKTRPHQMNSSTVESANLVFRVFEPEALEHAHRNEEIASLALVIDPVVADLERWISASGPLFTSLQSTAGTLGAENSDFILALLLHILARAFIIRVAGGKCTRETFYDRYNHYFADITNFAESIFLSNSVSRRDSSTYSRPQMVTMFDDAVVLPLMTVSGKCRDPLIRRKALDLLRAYPRVENTWDSRLVAVVCSAMMQIEEDGLFEGEDIYVPEARRVRISTLVRDTARHTRPRAVAKVKRGTQFMLIFIVGGLNL